VAPGRRDDLLEVETTRGGQVRAKILVGAAIVVLIGALVVGGTIVFLRSAEIQMPLLKAEVKGTASTSQGQLPHAFLNISTYPDSLAGEHGADGGPHPDWVSYSDTNLWVPAHSLVTVTITQYDSGEALLNPFFATVRGTVDGNATLDGQSFTHIAPDAVAHTFTMRSIPGNNSPDLFVNVPLAPVPDDAPNLPNGYPKPRTITFSFVTGAKGKYQFNCEFPCGSAYQGFGGPMSTIGYMAGTVTVG
jgi:hypothetical protein